MLEGRAYLIDRVRARMAFTESLMAIRSLAAKYSEDYYGQGIYIEDAANGSAVIDTIKDKIPGVIAVRADKAKTDRLNAVTPAFESGNIYFPDPSLAPWIHELIEELAVFPNGKHDDQVDSLSQALNVLFKRKINKVFDISGSNDDLYRPNPFDGI
jgi:predicted phage terminase large subunit-like protein